MQPPIAAEAEAFEVDGLKVIFRHNPAHEVVAARFYVRGGALNLQTESAGAELLYAQAARRGTRRYPKHELNAVLARLGVDLGASLGEDYTVFNLRCLQRHFATAWDVFTDVIADPTLEASDVEVVRRQALLEIRQRRDDPDVWLGELARRQCYAGHPYAPHPAGTEASMAGLEAEGLRAHMRRHLTRANAILVVVGDVRRQDLETRVAETLARLPRGDGHAPSPPPLRYDSGSLYVEARDLPTNYVLGHFAAPALRQSDHPPALIGLSVLRDRLFEEVRTKRNLSYAPSASLGQRAANLGSVYVTATDPQAALQVMRHEMRRMHDEPLDVKELQDKIRVFVTRYHLQNETNFAQAGFLAAHELLGEGWEKSRDFVPRLQAVTPEDVQRVARRILRHVQWVYLGDPRHATQEPLLDP